MRRNSAAWHNAAKQLSSKDNQMPDKYTTVWPALVEAFNTHGLAGLMAFVLGYLRIIYDGRESRPMRQFIEALLGACITVVSVPASSSASSSTSRSKHACTWARTARAMPMT